MYPLFDKGFLLLPFLPLVNLPACSTVTPALPPVNFPSHPSPDSLCFLEDFIKQVELQKVFVCEHELHLPGVSLCFFLEQNVHRDCIFCVWVTRRTLGDLRFFVFVLYGAEHPIFLTCGIFVTAKENVAPCG